MDEERQIDMSPEAIDRRLERVAQLLELCRELAAVKRAGACDAPRVREEADKD